MHWRRLWASGVVLKALADGANGILYVDDSQIDELHVIRHRGTDEDKAIMVVEEIE